MSVEGITSLPFLFCLRWRRGMSMRMRKTAKTGAVTFFRKVRRCTFVETTGIIRYNNLSIAVTNKHVRSYDIWNLNTA